ncbi:MAG: ROK family protein [Slackia sp.]
MPGWTGQPWRNVCAGVRSSRGRTWRRQAHTLARLAGVRHARRRASLWLGHGLGGGIIVNGRIVQGCHGFAGEIGQRRIRCVQGMEASNRLRRGRY